VFNERDTEEDIEARKGGSDATMGKVGDGNITSHRGAFFQLLLQWKHNKYYIL
jgi:hypothetical protein